eukprot:TRINITY_DN5432_c0_g2_i3.p1 TRINITY_DN5432_c0_g2~~TRINITY_DN5432_c0_g2_i3.p1  ORF type:complete len:166 (-),score=52.43 TRINITY_DN5432_c0_g2_i3:272-769(-)
MAKQSIKLERSLRDSAYYVDDPSTVDIPDDIGKWSAPFKTATQKPKPSDVITFTPYLFPVELLPLHMQSQAREELERRKAEIARKKTDFLEKMKELEGRAGDNGAEEEEEEDNWEMIIKHQRKKEKKKKLKNKRLEDENDSDPEATWKKNQDDSEGEEEGGDEDF